MTLNEARRQLDEIKMRMTEASFRLGEAHGSDRMRVKNEYLAAAREALQLKQLVRELSDAEHLGYVASHVGIEPPQIDSTDRESADMLLLEALNALVDLKCEWGIVDRIRGYFRQKPAERSDNSDLDFSRPVPKPQRELLKPEPVPLKTPSPIRYLDAHGRLAPGPGAVLYGRKRG